MSKPITIAIDGFSSTGKGTLARALAAELKYNYIDTGAMYRAVTWYGMQNGLVSGDDVQKDKLIALLGDLKLEFRFVESEGKSLMFVNGENRESCQCDIGSSQKYGRPPTRLG
jgi:cytidylate kinase